MTTWYEQLQLHRAIAVIRVDRLEVACEMAKAVAVGGIRQIEISAKSDRAAATIDKLRSDLPECTIGVGTLFDRHQLQEAIAAGAQFAFSPHTDPELIGAAVDAQIPMVPGALSPTEIVTAWQAGATAVKVFPISAMGGAGYISSLQGPLGHIPLIPTGGVTMHNARGIIDAGAVAVGLGSTLFPADFIRDRNWSGICALAQKLHYEMLHYGLQ
ncbi:MAG: bifunctional 4-hydroxy-2-oxoglutarate aldolase/2-dehydro-3-deoxy-phosphogluconate aldolase [Cyanobacteriota bacterium]|nr:bifunctional 4-hydroxy-2-oxoglutarate aldolase/2-dehydro-3-deoxy-phosphogluconate aldolase [Cyanobacteriota bacterium]